MTPVEQQFEQLKTAHPNSTMVSLPDGAFLITISGFELPPGWNKSKTDIIFIAPVGYPLAKPDCFWTDLDLRLANGGLPQNSQQNPIPNCTDQRWWFSWHLGAWNANTDDLSTYFNVIKRRMHEAI